MIILNELHLVQMSLPLNDPVFPVFVNIIAGVLFVGGIVSY
ncbi:MAG: hypothetical protein ACTSP4_16115 [Candidatus Hodarchaeales archaeon]